MPASSKAGDSAGGAEHSLLGLRHHDGTPITLADCRHWHAQALTTNRARTAERTQIEALPLTPETVAHLWELEREARIGQSVAAARCALLGHHLEAVGL